MSVARSMIARKNTDFENALHIWERYNAYALQAIRRFNVPAYYLTYQDLCGQPAETSREISRFLNLPMDERVAARFIDPGLNRSAHGFDSKGAPAASKGLIERVDRLEKAILKKTARRRPLPE